MTTDAYFLKRPRFRETSVVFASPHSGRNYDEAFSGGSVLDDLTLRSSEDAFVDQLFDAAPQLGAPLLCALAPRAFVDLNRSVEELDPALIAGLRRASSSPRVTSGLGVIPRVVSNGRAIYRGKLSMSEAQMRINQVWRPYHDCLQTLLDENLSHFGEAVLIDCHSMPSEALDSAHLPGGGKPDVVLGDRFGATAERQVVDRIEAAFTNAGFRVARNMPFAGAYIVQHYGRPARHQHAVQIEINRGLYMNEATVSRHADFDDVRTQIGLAIADITAFGRATDLPVAAE